jgi:hypothetical protein
MTSAERVAAVQALGFDARQAAFLTAVAIHSGYCLRRQYAAFSALRCGKSVRDFLERLVEQQLADRVTFRADRGAIYHLFGRRLYQAIGQEKSRNRRHAGPPVIARRLMLLDFVMAQPGADWYATEADTTALFVTRLGVPESVLPKRLQLPIFLRGVSASVNFVCLVTDSQASAIEAFIRDHKPLLRHLSDWTLSAAILQGVATDRACEAAYSRALAAASMMSVSKEDLDWFTDTRPHVVSGDLRSLGIDDLSRYRRLSTALGSRLETTSVRPLVVHHLLHSYAQFGSFAGVT